MALNMMTGNRALLKIKVETIGAGIVQNAEFSDDYGMQDVDGLGQAESVELVPGKVSHTISMSKYFVVGKTLAKLGYAPTEKDYLTSGELEIELIDNVSGETVELYTQCKVTSTGRSYGKHSLTTENASFRALKKLK